MKNCSKCGSSLSVGSKFCRSCGATVFASENAYACPSCGTQFGQCEKFCRGCGELLGQDSLHVESLHSVVCVVCGSPNKPEARFCKVCGKAVEVLAAVPVRMPIAALAQESILPSVMQSARTPSAVEPEAPTTQESILPSDEELVQSEPRIEPAVEVSQGGGGRRTLMIALALLIIAGLVLGLFLFFRGSMDVTNSTSAIAPENVTTSNSSASVPVLQPPGGVVPHPRAEKPLSRTPAGGASGESTPTTIKVKQAMKRDADDRREGVRESKGPGQLENDILRQLEEKKKRLGVQ